jgi:hypothetical protein
MRLTLFIFSLMGCLALSPAAHSTTHPKSKHKTSTPHIMSKSFDTLPNGESRSQRTDRLRRECKGRPNAGACLGYGVH